MENNLSIDNSIEEIIKTKLYNFNKEFNEKEKFEKIIEEYNFISDGLEQKLCMLKKYIELSEREKSIKRQSDRYRPRETISDNTLHDRQRNI